MQGAAKEITATWVQGRYPRITQSNIKAAALRTMVYWVRDVCLKCINGDAHNTLRAALFDSFARTDALLRGFGRHMQVHEQELVAALYENGLLAHNALAAQSFREGTQLWKIMPKRHALTHVAYDNKGVNPRAVHCYLDEDMVGRMKRLYQRCHGATAAQRSMERYVLSLVLRWVELRRERLRPARTA